MALFLRWLVRGSVLIFFGAGLSALSGWSAVGAGLTCRALVLLPGLALVAADNGSGGDHLRVRLRSGVGIAGADGDGGGDGGGMAGVFGGGKALRAAGDAGAGAGVWSGSVGDAAAEGVGQRGAGAA